MTAHMLWLSWLLLFFPIELPYVLRHKYAGTLTAHTRWAFCWSYAALPGPLGAWKYRPLWKTRRSIFCAFWAALTLHFVAGLPGWPWLVGPAIPFSLVFVISTLFERGEA